MLSLNIKAISYLVLNAVLNLDKHLVNNYLVIRLQLWHFFRRLTEKKGISWSRKGSTISLLIFGVYKIPGFSSDYS